MATDAFGQLRLAGSPANPGGATNAPAGGWQQSHLFAGEYWDQDSKLLYLRARWYDPQIGRFISADPFEGRQRDPRSLNRYGYAHGDPVHSVDPSGEMSLGEVNIAQSIQGGMRSAMPTVGKNALDIAKKAKIFDVYDYAMWPLHFYMYVERTGTMSGYRYDVGNRWGWPGMLKKGNPLGVIPGGYVSAEPVPPPRVGIMGRSVKIASLSLIQWLTWHASVVGTEMSCVIPTPYSLTPGVGTNCLSWTVWASGKALLISRMPM